jgi:hypothetical protein
MRGRSGVSVKYKLTILDWRFLIGPRYKRLQTMGMRFMGIAYF